MRIAVLDNVFWASGLLGEIALTLIMLYKGRWRTYPFFTTMIALDACTSSLLYVLRCCGNWHQYARVYWAYAAVNFILQLAVVVELARVVLRPTGTWVRDAPRQFMLCGLAGALLALGLSYAVAPPGSNRLDSLELKAALFTSLLICELFIAMSFAANNVGLGWRNHVIAIAQGLTAWSTVAVIIDSVHSYFGTNRFFGYAEHLKALAYIVALGYWSVQLWREEPERGPISAELRNYIVALHRRVQYDLEEAEQ